MISIYKYDKKMYNNVQCLYPKGVYEVMQNLVIMSVIKQYNFILIL